MHGLITADHDGRPGVALRRHTRDWQDRPIRPASALRSRYYLRFTVVDRPGVLAQIAGVLGEHAISISEVVQQGVAKEGEAVTLVITTHMAERYGATRDAERPSTAPRAEGMAAAEWKARRCASLQPAVAPRNAR